MIVDFDELIKLAPESLTFVIGAFDILHAGHIHFLEEAKRSGRGNKLLVGLLPDETVRQRKGADRPIIHEDERAIILDSLKVVDYVFIAPVNSISNISSKVIAKVHPEYSVATRDDWNARSEEWSTDGTELILIDKIPERSTSHIVRKIKNR